MFGGFGGVAPKGKKLSAGGGRGGQSVPNQASHGQPMTTSPLCLCDLQRKGDKARKKK
jgi:hypothetical protein